MRRSSPTDGAPLALALRGVRREFRSGFLGLSKRVALDGIDLELAPGTTLGLVGSNGSGKSTLLRIAAGVDRPDDGQVRVFGGDPTRDGRAGRGARRRLAYLPEESPFPGELSARSCLALIGSLSGSGMSRAELRARGAQLMARVGLAGREGSRLSSFSRGMLRRFGLAQAFLCEPDLVLLDEPTAGLDAPGFGVLADLCDAARARGAAIVLASHLPVDLEQRCDLAAVLLDGRVAALDTPAALLAGGGMIDLYRRLEGASGG